MQLDMGAADWNPKKPYDLRERLFEFGCLVIRLVQYLHTRGPVGMKLSEQILKAGTSAPANYEEADDASGGRDKRAKRRIALRELKEVRLRLRMLRRCDLLTSEHDPVIDESDELVRIVATVIRKSESGSCALNLIGSWELGVVGSRALGVGI
jgi:four helix bundle protein